MKKIFFKVLPYLASILAGVIFLVVGFSLNKNIRALFISISAAFFAIPLIYLFYQIAYNFSKKKLNKEMFDYAKMQVDKEVLSVLNQIYKLVYNIEEVDFTFKGIKKFLLIKKEDIKKLISEREYFGFQIFKDWENTENNLHDTLRNSYILKGLDDGQIITLISIIKSMRYLEKTKEIEDMYIKVDRNNVQYKIIKGKEINEDNIRFPNRYLFLEELDNDKFLVSDFGDFPIYNKDKLLLIFRVDEKYIEFYSDAIYDLIKKINRWLNTTGNEFVIDTKMFRPRYKGIKKEII